MLSEWCNQFCSDYTATTHQSILFLVNTSIDQILLATICACTKNHNELTLTLFADMMSPSIQQPLVCTNAQGIPHAVAIISSLEEGLKGSQGIIPHSPYINLSRQQKASLTQI